MKQESIILREFFRDFELPTHGKVTETGIRSFLGKSTEGGALSDRIGKRKIFITFGYILWGVSILCFAALRKDWIVKMFPVAAESEERTFAI